MSDYPGGERPHKPTYSTLGFRVCIARGQGPDGPAAASAAWPSANLAIYMPFTIRVPYYVTKLWWINGGTANGNVDIGIYTGAGTKLTSTGVQTQTGTAAIQKVTLGTAVLLSPDQYYLALGLSSGTGTIRFVTGAPAAAGGEIDGMLQQATAVALPATATFAAYAQTTGLPICGMSNATIL